MVKRKRPTIQWLIEKGQMTYNDLQTTTKKIKDGETLTPTKIQRTRDICQ